MSGPAQSRKGERDRERKTKSGRTEGNEVEEEGGAGWGEQDVLVREVPENHITLRAPTHNDFLPATSASYPLQPAFPPSPSLLPSFPPLLTRRAVKAVTPTEESKAWKEASRWASCHQRVAEEETSPLLSRARRQRRFLYCCLLQTHVTPQGPASHLRLLSPRRGACSVLLPALPTLSVQQSVRAAPCLMRLLLPLANHRQPARTIDFHSPCMDTPKRVSS